ncbi:MAG: SDR family oxidoreductase [Fibrobacterota bacterium]|nr:SDR family oxidoreductase [Fibrobacterota bacterium]
MARDKNLENRIVLVTGSSRGIGKEIAVVLGQAGAKVAICARDRKELDIAIADLRREKITCLSVLTDVEKAGSAKAVVGKVREAWGGLDILVNNVGGLARTGHFEDLDDKAWSDSFNLNLMPMVRFCREALPLLKKSSHPRIINISSMVASQPGAFNPHYSTFKAAVLNLTKNLSGAYAKDGILVNSISPGIIQTEGWDQYIKEKAKKEGITAKHCREIENLRASEIVPLKRLGTVREVADLAAFLASDQASFITGSNHRVDGGRVLSI